MAGNKSILAGIAALGLVAAGALGAAVVAPDMLARAKAQDAPEGAASFRGIAPLAFEDAEGDASDAAWGDLGTYADCAAGGILGGGCLGLVPAVRSPRAAPHLDILALGLAEPTADEVVVTLSIARLDEGLAALASPPGMHRMTTYGVCFYTENGCTRAASLHAMRHGEDAHLEARFEGYSEACNAWWWCAWPLPVDVQYGAPATITWTIPKAWFAFDGALEVRELDAAVWWSDQPTAFPMWHGGATLHTPVRHVHDHTFTPGAFGVADVTPGFPVGATLAPPTRAPPTPLDAPLASGRGGATHAHGSSYDRPELDLVGFDMHEESDGTLVLVLALTRADAHPTYDFDYSVALAFAGRPTMEIGYRQEHGEPMGYAGVCIMEECQESRTHEVPAEFVTGAPAFVVVRLPPDVLADLGAFEAGETTTLVWVSSMVTDGSQYFGEYDGAVYGDVHHAFMADEIVGALPFTLGSGHRASPDAFAARHAH